MTRKTETKIQAPARADARVNAASPTLLGKGVRRRARRSVAGPAGFGGALLSPRDRQRVRDRNAAERGRVEQMLAKAPLPLASSPIASPLDPLVTPAISARGRTAFVPRVVPSTSCPVCSQPKVVFDEVASAGTLRLAECLHCDHRWTERSSMRARMAAAPAKPMAV